MERWEGGGGGVGGGIHGRGDAEDAERASVFNLGIGMLGAGPAGDRFQAIDTRRREGHRAVDLGELVPGSGHVRIEDR